MRRTNAESPDTFTAKLGFFGRTLAPHTDRLGVSCRVQANECSQIRRVGRANWRLCTYRDRAGLLSPGKVAQCSLAGAEALASTVLSGIVSFAPCIIAATVAEGRSVHGSNVAFAVK